jgi:hypothetical protein
MIFTFKHKDKIVAVINAHDKNHCIRIIKRRYRAFDEVFFLALYDIYSEHMLKKHLNTPVKRKKFILALSDPEEIFGWFGI